MGQGPGSMDLLFIRLTCPFHRTISCTAACSSSYHYHPCPCLSCVTAACSFSPWLQQGGAGSGTHTQARFQLTCPLAVGTHDMCACHPVVLAVCNSTGHGTDPEQQWHCVTSCDVDHQVISCENRCSNTAQQSVKQSQCMDRFLGLCRPVGLCLPPTGPWRRPHGNTENQCRTAAFRFAPRPLPAAPPGPGGGRRATLKTSAERQRSASLHVLCPLPHWALAAAAGRHWKPVQNDSVPLRSTSSACRPLVPGGLAGGGLTTEFSA
jgi:hypothetical protein